jgi:hypothetical protein
VIAFIHIQIVAFHVGKVIFHDRITIVFIFG